MRLLRLMAAAALLLATAMAHGEQDPPPVPPPASEEAESNTADAAELPADASPRAHYNVALALLQDDAFQGATDGFLAARDAAGADATLRYRAAFNLGLALAGQADAAQDAPPAEALETLRTSAAWFHDATRLAPAGDDDARVNLELVLRRIERLADSINRANTLEARLDRIIDDQRGLRDGIRRLLTDINAQGAAAQPTGFAADFEALAARERALLAEVSAVADLGTAERGHIDNLDAPTPEQSVRHAQLTSMERFLQRSRQSLSDTRRRLRRLEGERAHRRADAALAELKRAREQLQDPLTTLRAIVRDEAALLGQTAAMAALAEGRIAVEEEGSPSPLPTWLTPRLLANRQEDAAARTGATLRRVEAAATAADGESNGNASTAPEAEDPAAARVQQAAAEAAPLLENGLAAMRDALAALENEAFDTAVEAQADAVRTLNRAIERFADLRGLIELAYADQGQATALLTPPADDDPANAVRALSAADRARAVAELATDNRERLSRIEPLLRETLPTASDEGETDAAAAEQRYELAESHRAAAARELDALTRALDPAGPSHAEALPPAQAALSHLEALRRIFFSFSEHLQALIVEQSDTHDRAATLQFEAQLDRLVPELGMLAERQTDHAAVGDSLAQALAERADAASASPVPDDPAGAQAANGETLAKAVVELRAGAAHMHGADAIIAAATEAAAASSPDLEPALTEQLAAIERLENALRLLQPPGQDQDGAGEGEQAANQPQQAEAPSDEQAGMSQRQAMRRLQAIRDRDAQRRRDRRQGPGQPDPVEKDW